MALDLPSTRSAPLPTRAARAAFVVPFLFATDAAPSVFVEVLFLESELLFESVFYDLASAANAIADTGLLAAFAASFIAIPPQARALQQQRTKS